MGEQSSSAIPSIERQEALERLGTSLLRLKAHYEQSASPYGTPRRWGTTIQKRAVRLHVEGAINLNEDPPDMILRKVEESYETSEGAHRVMGSFSTFVEPSSVFEMG